MFKFYGKCAKCLFCFVGSFVFQQFYTEESNIQDKIKISSWVYITANCTNSLLVLMTLNSTHRSAFVNTFEMEFVCFATLFSYQTRDFLHKCQIRQFLLFFFLNCKMIKNGLQDYILCVIC